jgi:hypothetical protein
MARAVRRLGGGCVMLNEGREAGACWSWGCGFLVTKEDSSGYLACVLYELITSCVNICYLLRCCGHGSALGLSDFFGGHGTPQTPPKARIWRRRKSNWAME